MPIGRLRHRIIIQQPTIARNARGAEILTWSTLTTVYADIRTVGGQEQLLSNQLEVASLSHTISIRYLATVTPKMRVKWGARVFGIEAIIERDNKQRMMDLSCREIVGDAEVI